MWQLADVRPVETIAVFSMSARVFVAGTDTGVGKMICSAVLADALGADRWKPIQSGLEGETDSQAVQWLFNLPKDRILPEAFELRTPVSPYLAAEIDDVTIDVGQLAISH
jgi:dethiobiotin synthetase